MLQRREQAALRRPFLPSADESARLRSRFEVTTDQREHTLVFDLTRHVGHQDIVVDPIKELLEIKFHAQAVTCGHVAASGFEGLVSASTRTKAVAVVRGQRIEDWRELLQQCLLDQAIHDAGNTQLPCSAFGFGDVNGAYTLRVILAGQQPHLEGRPVLFHVPPIRRPSCNRHPVRPCC